MLLTSSGKPFLVTSIDLILIPTVLRKPDLNSQIKGGCTVYLTALSVLPFYLLQSTSETSPDPQAPTRYQLPESVFRVYGVLHTVEFQLTMD